MKIDHSKTPSEIRAAETEKSRQRLFATTRWTVIQQAGDSHLPEHDDALAQLCQIYWYPVYAFVRRQGNGSEDAQDLTQEFFARVLSKRNSLLEKVERERGKFRWFLLGAVRHFLANERAKERAAKRGGGKEHIRLDEVEAEKRYALEPRDELTPERLFEHTWAMTILDRVTEQLREHYVQAGKERIYEQLKAFLPGSHEKRSYADVAEYLGCPEGTVRVQVHRFKDLFRRFLRTEVAHTVEGPAEIDEELRHLIGAILLT